MTAAPRVDFNALDAVLRAHSADLVRSTGEKFELREVGAQSSGEQIRFMRNRAFEITRDAIREQPGQAALFNAHADFDRMHAATIAVEPTSTKP